MRPRVSAIIATRKRPELLRRALESVAGQSYSDVEAVVVDENDADSQEREETAAVVEAVRDRLSVAYLSDRSPAGVCRARNEGVAAANGSIVAILDDDDWWRQDKVERQVSRFQESELEPSLVYTGLEVVNGEGRQIKTRVPTLRGNLLYELLRENVIGTPSSIALWKSTYEELGGFDPAFPTRHDFDLYIRVAERYPIDVVSDPVTVYLNHNPQAMSKQFENKMEGHRLAFEKHLHHYRSRPDLEAAYHYGTALVCLRHNRTVEARGYLKRSLRARVTGRAAARLALTYLPGA
jgi:glycosyltransferase involved in cell wall biosynthesis